MLNQLESSVLVQSWHVCVCVEEDAITLQHHALECDPREPRGHERDHVDQEVKDEEGAEEEVQEQGLVLHDDLCERLTGGQERSG